jgi:hypothetical protein
MKGILSEIMLILLILGVLSLVINNIQPVKSTIPPLAVFAQLTPPISYLPRIFVDPPIIINPAAVPCVTNFLIDVSIVNMTNVKTIEFNLTYSSSVIGLIGPNFLTVDGQFPSPSINANDSAGFLWIRLTYPTPENVTNPTPIITITFHVRSRGATSLNLSETLITDGSGNPISHKTYNGFFMAEIRDVAVTNVVPSRTWAYAGWPVNVTVTVKNKGNVSETFNVSAFYDGSLIGNITVMNLPANGGQQNIVFTWNTTGVAEGNYTIKAVAQAVPYQLNISDLTFVDGKVQIMTKRHDIAVVNISLTGTLNNTAYQGWIVGVNVTAQNLGSFPETFNVSAFYNSTLLIGTAHVVSLAPSALFNAVFSLNTSTLSPCHSYPISANATQIPYESNVTNNYLADGKLKVRLYGDVNGDGKVNLSDIFAVAMAFGTMPGQQRWNAWADLNHDLKIDLKDYFAVVINFGKACS